jgi:hypothetical protein
MITKIICFTYFWNSVKEKYPVNIITAVFASYMCEQSFSSLTSIKSKDRNQLISVEDELCVCLSKV